MLNTGIFGEDRYFDIFVEYAKADPEDICIRIEARNRGPTNAPLHILPHLRFRSRWSWGSEPPPEPQISIGPNGTDYVTLVANDSHAPPLTNLPFEYRLGTHYLYGEAGARLLFTNNETHAERVWGPHARSRSPYFKDAFHRHIINGEDCINPAQVGTKACLYYANLIVPSGGSVVIRLRLIDRLLSNPLVDVDALVETRRTEADALYDTIHPPQATEDERRIQRQAFAGMLWNKQVHGRSAPTPMSLVLLTMASFPPAGCWSPPYSL